MTTARQLRFRGEAREKVLRGATTLADAVRATLGPKARCVLLDPTKVVRVALENAVSVAGTLLLAEATLTEVREEDADRHRRDVEPALEGQNPGAVTGR